MMDSVSLFFRNLIKYFLYIAVFAQIVSGTVYLVCNFAEYLVYPETEEMVNVAGELLFDEYTGVLYPLFIRVCLWMQDVFGIGYYLPVHLVQILLVVFSLLYLVGYFFKGKQVWIVTAYIVCFPMFMQTVLMVSPFAFKAAFCFVIIGAMVRLWKGTCRVSAWILLFAAYVLSALNLTDDLYMWIIPIGIFCLAMFIKNRKTAHLAKRICVLLIMILLFSGTLSVLDNVVEPGVRGRMQRTVGSVLFQRTLWPELNVKYGFLPEELRNYIDIGTTIASDNSAETMIYDIGANIDKAVGFEKANSLYLEAFRNQLSYNKRAMLKVVLDDCSGYLLTPYSTIKYLSGREGSCFSNLYGVMCAQSPRLIYIYFCIGFVALFIMTFAGVIQVIRKKLLINKTCVKQLLFFVGILFYQALWYSIVNVQGVDYRYGLFNIAVFSMFAIGVALFMTNQTYKERNAQ